MTLIKYLVCLPLSLCALSSGFYCFKFPGQAIRQQKNFYKLINWRIEPIDMVKEIKNTQGMGLLLIILSLISIVLFFI